MDKRVAEEFLKRAMAANPNLAASLDTPEKVNGFLQRLMAQDVLAKQIALGGLQPPLPFTAFPIIERVRLFSRVRLGQWTSIEVAGVPRKAPPPKPSLHTLYALSDLAPSPNLRKRLKKLLADQGAHVEELYGNGKYKSARWIAFSTWALCFWYAAKSPVSSLLSAAKRQIG